MLERLNFSTIRFDEIADAVVIDGRKITVEIARDAFAVIGLKADTGEEAMIGAMKESRRLNRLANIIPSDDGKINITAALMLNNGQFGQLE